MDEQIVLLDLSIIDPPTDAARDTIDPDKVRELAESIRSAGLIEPIVVRPFDGRFEVVVGHRRFLAHKLLGLDKIKVIVRELGDDQVFLIRGIENDQRVDLNPIERAKNYKRIRDRFNFSTHQIAQKVGRSHQTIMRYLKLLEVPEDFQGALAKGVISIDVALCLVKIEDPEWRSYYFKNAVDNGVTFDVAQFWVNEYNKTRTGSGPESEGGMGVDVLVSEPTPVYGTCVVCLGPEDVTKLKYIPVCQSCLKEVKGILNPNKR